MNKKNIFALILLALLLLVSSCDGNNENPNTKTPEKCETHIDLNDDNICDNCATTIETNIKTPYIPVIEVTAVKEKISLKDTEVLNYNYKTLFEISSDGKKIPVVESYLDLTQVSDAPGTFEIVCTYEDKTAKVSVEVIETIYEVILSVDEITINKTLVEEYDYLSLFTAKIDGVLIDITSSMIESNVSTEAGRYEFKVTNNKVSKTLIVNVTNLNKIEIINTYNDVEICLNELENFDFTTLFSVYVNDETIEVTLDMIDISALTDVVIGESYDISLTCVTDENELTKTIKVKIIEAKELTITAKNLVIYPNAEYIDLCTLFEIKYGDEIIPVKNEMISGSINYTTVGINEITLNYNGKTATSTIEVKKGVVINHRYTDTITIKKGTNKKSYFFANDFIVVVNGVEMKFISDEYLDTSAVDFDTVGTYEAKITIPYNENRVGLSGVKFTYYEETINYVVVENEYEITILKDLVELEEGTTEYDVYKNIKVRINNRNQTLTEIPEYASVIACYVELRSEAIDFTKPGIQKVEVAIYVNGPNNDPVIISYDLVVATSITVEKVDKVIYTGETLFTRDLFKIINGKDEVEVTNDMIDGHVNTFKPGVYYVKLEYSGIEVTSKVVVLDRYILGTYKTLQTSIPVKSTNESDEEVVTPGKILSNLTINEDGTIKIGNRTAHIINAIDENTFIVKLISYEYTLYYNDGIIILNPENNIRLEFNEDKRPLIYFNSDIWQVMDILTVNNKETHVLSASYPSYSIDVFKIQSKVDYSQKWYGLKVEMTSKMNSDTIYEVTWGEVKFDDDFVYDINKESSLTLNNIRYNFKVGANKTAKILKDEDTKKYANMTFNGLYNGQEATLYVDHYGAYTFFVNSEKVFYISSYDLDQLKVGGQDFENDIVLLYNFNEVYSYQFSLNLDDLKFEFIDKELTFGKYCYDNLMFFFDGYGNGIFKEDMKSYYEYPFKYSVNGKEIKLEFIKPKDDFTFGEVINLYLDDFGNLLTIGSCLKDELIGIKFENQVITDGAIIRVNTTKIGKNTDNNAKKELYASIEIITKDGIVTGDSIKNYVNTSAIRFSVPGFYQFSITVDLNGATLTSYYGLEVMDSVYEGNVLVGEYNAVIDASTKLSIDKYGVCHIVYAGKTYEGMVKIYEDNTFIINAFDSLRNSVMVTGELLKGGIISVRSTGAVTFNEVLTTGAVEVIGCDGLILRMILINEEKTFVLSEHKLSFGSFVEMQILEGNSVFEKDTIISLKGENEVVVKIRAWDNLHSGLIPSDGYRGIYSSNGLNDIFVDGFGNVKYSNLFGTYDLNRNVITVMMENETFVLRLNKDSATYEKIDIELNNTLVEGKSYSSSYIYYCSDYAYNANTTFVFKSNGVVVVKSSSADHDSGDDMCSNDTYSPIFATLDGTTGTYIVTGNKITVVINEIEFVLKISNVLDVQEIICISTNLDTDSHGYFGEDTIFIL